MSFTTFQQSLARLLTDEAAREKFVAQPEIIGTAWQLTPAEIENLQTMAARDIPEFARSLHAKRRVEVADLMPRTRRVLAGQFADLFARHAAQFVPNGPHKPRADAIAFARWLQRQKHRGKSAREAARYESFLLRAFDGRCRISYFEIEQSKYFVLCARGRIFSWPRPKQQSA